MARDIVDIALVEIDSSVFSGEAQTIISMSVGDEDTKTPVKTMRRKRRALGYTRGIPEFPVDLEVVETVGESEVPWKALQRSGERFSITYEEADGGKRSTLIDVVVNSITKPFNENGESKRSIKCMALDEKEEV